MPFAIPDDLAPEVYPLAWLLGTWRGPGFLAYPDISERPFVQEVTFSHDGGPYLSYRSTMWLLDEHPEAAQEVAQGAEASSAEASSSASSSSDASSTEVTYSVGNVWASESGYWRVAASGPESVPPPAGGSADGPSPTGVEVLIAEPSGHVSVYLGTVQGPRIEIATDLVARTSTAAEVSAVHRMYGLVGGELMWAIDMAAFGHEMRPYASARLARRADAGQRADESPS